MRRGVCLCLLFWTALPLAGQEIRSRPEAELRKEPIALGGGEVVTLLARWWRQGTAAGNIGDWYDNRDSEHSPLDIRQYPQLQKVHYTQEMKNAGAHWAGQTKALPIVLFGNSSTSAAVQTEGSNARQFYTSPIGLKILEQQYAKNNLYIYPEHHDHDPGRNGRGLGSDEGYGDLYPANTPYVIISQGSSFSDQPFMKAIPYVLAAFHPDVKTKLADNGMLMPTVQMIFRASNKHLKQGEYLTAKAHPSAFDAAWLDPVKMVKMAHDLRVDALPPLVRLKVVAEGQVRPGIDFFDPTDTEALGDTSSAIARLFRGKDLTRKMTVSAEASQDLGGKPLKFEWKVLRGDPLGIKITPKNAAGSVAEIEVTHPKRRPVAADSPLESSRVDIGIFAYNGVHWSAPAFVTWYSFDQEARTYDDQGRIRDIAYASGETRIVVKDWWKLLAKENERWFPPLSKEQKDVVAALKAERDRYLDGLKQALADAAADTKRLAELQADAVRLEGAAAALERKLAVAPETEKNALRIEQRKVNLEKVTTNNRIVELKLRLSRDEKVAQTIDDKQQKKFVETFGKSHLARLEQLSQSTLVDNADYKALAEQATAAQKAAVQNLADRLRQFEFKPEAGAKDRPLIDGPAAFDRELLAWLNAERLAQIAFPDTLHVQRLVNFVDYRLSLKRSWRDVYLYDPSGQYVGWARVEPGQQEPAYFTPDGLVIAERDELGRCRQAKKVNYSFSIDPTAADRFHLRWAATAAVLEYEYANPDDRRGRIKRAP
jgi:hypothetical protein